MTQTLERIPILDLRPQYESLKSEIHEAITRVLERGDFIMGEEVRLFEQEEKLKSELVGELKKGEKSGFVEKFDRTRFVKKLHVKYAKNGL